MLRVECPDHLGYWRKSWTTGREFASGLLSHPELRQREFAGQANFA